MQIEPNENASKRMCTSQFSNRFVIVAAPHSGTRRNIGHQRVEASDQQGPVGVAYSFNVKGTFSRIRLSTSEPTGMDLSFFKQLPYSPLAHHRNTEGRWYQWRVALCRSDDC